MEVLVVGGGVVGQSIAFSLLRAGLRVKHIYPETGFLTCATLAAGAMLGTFAEITHESCEGTGALELEFRYQSARLYPHYLAELAERSSIHVEQRRGTFIIANSFGRGCPAPLFSTGLI